jgi:predicted enzyme involved in methoxymalonyl-ACP biosynthesis
MARERAASALLLYLEERTLANERALLDATHELEAVAAMRRLERIPQRASALRRAPVAMSR